MPKAVCIHFTAKQDSGYCKLTKDICGHQRWCKAENTFKLNDTCINCPIPNKYKKI